MALSNLFCVLVAASQAISPLHASLASYANSTVLEEREVIDPSRCRSAIEITDYWRKDKQGKNIKPGGIHSSDGYACDMHLDMEDHWFRFAGAAGTKLLDTCPKPYSCGTRVGIWTDEPMPTEVGRSKVVKAYQAVGSGDCKSVTNNILVIRCSKDSEDFVYRNLVRYSHPCSYAFCSM